MVLLLDSSKYSMFHNKLFACHLETSSRLIRIIAGVLLNVVTLLVLDILAPPVFWSMVLASYVMLFEAFWGCSVLHWVVRVHKSEADCGVCGERKKRA